MSAFNHILGLLIASLLGHIFCAEALTDPRNTVIARITGTSGDTSTALSDINMIFSACEPDSLDWDRFADVDKDLTWEFLTEFSLNASICRWKAHGRKAWAAEVANVIDKCKDQMDSNINCAQAAIQALNESSFMSFSYTFLRIDRADQLLRHSRRAIEADKRSMQIVQSTARVAKQNEELTNAASYALKQALHIEGVTSERIQELALAVDSTRPLFQVIERVKEASNLLRKSISELIGRYVYTIALIRALGMVMVLGMLNRRFVGPIISCTAGLCFPQFASAFKARSSQVLIILIFVETLIFCYTNLVTDSTLVEFVVAIRLVFLILWIPISVALAVNIDSVSSRADAEVSSSSFQCVDAPHTYLLDYNQLNQYRALVIPQQRPRKIRFVTRIGFARVED